MIPVECITEHQDHYTFSSMHLLFTGDTEAQIKLPSTENVIHYSAYLPNVIAEPLCSVLTTVADTLCNRRDRSRPNKPHTILSQTYNL